MWVKKTPEELEEAERQRRRASFNPSSSVFFAACIAMLIVFSDWMGWHGAGSCMRSCIPLPFEKAILKLPFAFLFSFCMFYGLKLLGLNPFLSASSAGICCRCSKVQTVTRRSLCECGGNVEPIENFRWVPGDAGTQDPPDPDGK